ncbi:MAG: ATP-binding cassette domain-containing protein [Endomicrobium sp.]|jgi:ATP-binding cassette subfamily F protein 3|nr:ATP-binding cassette domain-containing protein [Endomicrobium sp.]
MIKISDLSKSFGQRTLFDGLDLTVNPKERVGLVGRNGHGKTTLFKMILGEMEYDSGEINIPKNYKIGFLRQHINFSKTSAIEEVCTVLNPQDLDSERWKGEKTLSGLGFSKEDMLKNPMEFSGGYKIRINLAKVLLSDSDMLMLDEPNNYLDIVAIRWLVNFLRSWKGELLLITHDRKFMDSVITHCAAIHRGKIRKVEGNTQKVYEQIEQEEEIYEKTRTNIEKKRKQTEIFIRRFRAKARLAGMVQSRIKSLEKQGDMQELTSIEDLDFSFSSVPFAAAKMLETNNLEFGYSADKPLMQKLKFEVLKKERICVIGKNGKGKSTLLKLLAGRLKPTAGNIKTHPDLKISYFVQSDSANLNPQKTVFEEIMNTDASCITQKARNIAGAMMFSGDDALKKIEFLSGGEKARVLLGKILVQPAHLLLLDEPTNHLDLESCESLIDAVNDFEGSVILVTHNEQLLDNIAQKLIIFDRDKVSVFDGTYRDFLSSCGWEDEGGSIKSKTNKSKKVYTKEESKRMKAKLIQEKSAIITPLEAEIAALEKQIETAEKELKQNNETLIQASIDKNIAQLSKIPKLTKKLTADIENFYAALSQKTSQLDSKKEHFRRQMELL